jgi:hypothetical protein
MQGSDDFPRRPSPWRRFPQADVAGQRKDMAGLIGQELPLVFSVAQTSDDLDGVHRLLEQIEMKRKRAR